MQKVSQKLSSDLVTFVDNFSPMANFSKKVCWKQLGRPRMHLNTHVHAQKYGVEGSGLKDNKSDNARFSLQIGGCKSSFWLKSY